MNLKESPEIVSYGCLMAHFTPYTDRSILEMAKSIPGLSLHENGYENEPHATVLYGFQDEFGLVDKLKAKIDTIAEVTCRITNLSYFTSNPEFDVLKFDVESKDLTKLNNWCRVNCDHHLTHPDYHPHITLGYMKKGTRFETELMKNFVGSTILVNHFIYSTKNKVKTKIEL